MNSAQQTREPGPTGIASGLFLGPESRGRGTLLPTSSQFVAFDIRSPFFSGHERRDELARLYMDVFNSVTSVPNPWTFEAAQHMVGARLDKVGCNIALVDVDADNKVIGAFLSNIVPGSRGWNLSEPDILIAEKYRGTGLGSELGWLGRRYADEICMDHFDDFLLENNSKTYREPAFPKTMWESKGYRLLPLFEIAGKEVAAQTPPPSQTLEMDDISPENFAQLVAFITNRGDVLSSDGHIWDHKRAEAYVKFMYANHNATFIVAKSNHQIVALGSADIMPGRIGTTMIDPQIFVNNQNALVRNHGKLITTADVSGSIFYQLFAAAKGVSKNLWGKGIAAIEIPHDRVGFFRTFLPGLRQDKHFLGMTGDHQTLIGNLQPAPPGRSKIALIPYRTTSGIRATA